MTEQKFKIIEEIKDLIFMWTNQKCYEGGNEHSRL